MDFNLNVPRVTVPGGARMRVLWIAGAAVLALLVGYNSCTTYVKPGEAGVKQIKFGLGKGIDPTVYATGLHYVGVGETMHRFPLRLQVLELSNSRGEAEVKKLEADADLYRRKKAADGDLLVKLAEAQGTELENQALRGVGSENMVGLRMAEALKGTRLIVLPSDGEGGMNPLDLKTLMRRFDVKE